MTFKELGERLLVKEDVEESRWCGDWRRKKHVVLRDEKNLDAGVVSGLVEQSRVSVCEMFSMDINNANRIHHEDGNTPIGLAAY